MDISKDIFSLDVSAANEWFADYLYELFTEQILRD